MSPAADRRWLILANRRRRVLHDRPRRRDRERRDPVDPDRSERHRDDGPVGADRLRDHVRRLPLARRPDGRPARPQADLPRRARPLHHRLARLRPRQQHLGADRRARGAGHRRGDHLARRPVDRDDDLRGGRRAEQGARDLGRSGRLGRRRGRAHRRDPDRVSRLGVDLLRQRPGRRARARAGAAVRPREPCRARPSPLRRGRRRYRHRRAGAAGVRDLEGARRRLGVGADDPAAARLDRDPGGLRPDRAPLERAAGAVPYLPDSAGARRKRRRLPPRCRDLRELPRVDPLRPADTRLVGGQDRSHVPRDRGDGRHLGRCRPGADDALRPAAGDHDGNADPGRRHGLVHPAPGRRPLLARPAAALPDLRARPGVRVRPGDDRCALPGRAVGRRARLGTDQHEPADRRRNRRRDRLDGLHLVRQLEPEADAAKRRQRRAGDHDRLPARLLGPDRPRAARGAAGVRAAARDEGRGSRGRARRKPRPEYA